MEIRGRDLINGLPKTVKITSEEVREALSEPVQAIVEAVLPRRTCFSRRAAGNREEEQGIAAYIDRVFLVCGLDMWMIDEPRERKPNVPIAGRGRRPFHLGDAAA